MIQSIPQSYVSFLQGDYSYEKGFLSPVLEPALKSTPFSKLECPQCDMAQHYLLNIPLLCLYCLTSYLFKISTFFRQFPPGLITVHGHFLCW